MEGGWEREEGMDRRGREGEKEEKKRREEIYREKTER